jgi:hypothetical protein
MGLKLNAHAMIVAQKVTERARPAEDMPAADQSQADIADPPAVSIAAATKTPKPNRKRRRVTVSGFM